MVRNRKEENRKGVIIKKQNLYYPLDNINIEKQLIVLARII